MRDPKLRVPKLSYDALELMRYCGLKWEDDLRNLREGKITPEQLLEECLDSASTLASEEVCKEYVLELGRCI